MGIAHRIFSEQVEWLKPPTLRLRHDRIGNLMIAFIIASCFSGLLVIACVASQSDYRILPISRRHAVCLDVVLCSLLVIPEVMLMLSNWLFASESAVVLSYGIVAFQFIVIALIYVKYRLVGVLALHVSGILILLLFIATSVLQNITTSGQVFAIAGDTKLYLMLAAVGGSLASVSYAVGYIAVRRQRAK